MKQEKKRNYVSFRATDFEYDRIKEGAKREGKNISDYLRARVFSDDFELQVMRRLEGADEKMNQMIFQLRKAGVNINQIAHSCNAGYFIDVSTLAEDIAQMEKTVREGFREIREITKGALEDGSDEADVSERNEKR